MKFDNIKRLSVTRYAKIKNQSHYLQNDIIFTETIINGRLFLTFEASSYPRISRRF